jgi:bifunctional non-homologous end joining protein LigD
MATSVTTPVAGRRARKGRPALARYRAKRDFAVTPEPSPEVAPRAAAGQRAFVVQKHDATRLHYDVRLEIAGAMMSFAVPKGPSYDPSVKRLAVETEDHPISYNDFEGEIPHGEYGAGPVIVWDRGHYETVPPGREEAMREKGHLHVRLFGEKLEGDWHLVRTGRDKGERSSWLLFKAKDAIADAAMSTGRDPVTDRPESVITGERLPRDAATPGSRGPSPAVAKAKVTNAKVTKAKVTKAKARGAASSRPVTSWKRLGEVASGVELATLVPSLARGDQWLFEIKYDGYRILAIKRSGEVRLWSRNGKDWTDHFPAVAAAVACLPAADCVLDGEVCALDASGRPSFNLLQNWLSTQGHATLSYPVFDLLWLDRRDLRGEPIEARRAALEALIDGAPTPLSLSKTVEGDDPAALLEVACARGLEGLIAKKRGSRYVAGRTRDWLKLKCTHRQEFALIGYLPLTGTTDRVGSLFLALRGDDGAFHYAGKVGTGFDAKARRDLAARLDAHRVPTAAAVGAPRTRAARWASPELVGEVAFTEWTPDAKVRHPSFLGLRADKRPVDCVREQAVRETREAGAAIETDEPSASTRAAPREPAPIAITNPEKILFPRDAITKLDVATYYREVAAVLVPHVRGRPLALQRWPQGIDGPSWFQQKAPSKVPPFVRTIPVDDRTHVSIENRETLEWLAGLAALTFHQWSSRVPVEASGKPIDRALARPEYVVFDLDPGNGPLRDLLEVAAELRRMLEDLGLESVPKTSGKRGLHVIVPIAPDADHAAASTFAESLATAVARRTRTIATVERSKAARGGRLYVDWMQNGRGKTIVSPYTLRAIDRAPASTPLRWSEVGPKLDPSAFGPKEILRRLERHGDLFARALRCDQRLPSPR